MLYMTKILVTGGAGFIGSNLVDKLILEGNQVVVLDDLSSGKQDYINPKVKFYKLDILSDKVDEIFAQESFDYVYHLAAQIDVRTSVSNPALDNKINVLGGLNILEKAKKYNVKKVIFASTGGAIYGEAEEIPTSETSPTYPVSPYGINKLAFEKYLNYYFKVYGLDYTILRFANVYGPRQFKGGEAGVIAIFIDNAVKNKTSVQYGDGKQTRDFVFVFDVVSALSKAKDVSYQGEINISLGREVSLLEVREKIAEALGSEIEVREEAPKLGEQRRSCLSRKLAKEILNWEPKFDLKEGIKETINWAKKQVN